jgi:hypothetical protein
MTTITSRMIGDTAPLFADIARMKRAPGITRDSKTTPRKKVCVDIGCPAVTSCRLIRATNAWGSSSTRD